MDYSVRNGSQVESRRIPTCPGAIARKGVDEECSLAAASPLKAYDLDLTAASRCIARVVAMAHKRYIGVRVEA